MPVTLPETIVRRRCAALIPYARNARTHSDQQVAQIAASIREFGFTNPVLIDEEDGIIAGHGRVLGAHLLGLDEVPCIVLAHLTPAQRRAYVLADNKLALNAGWDLEMLSLEIGELGEAGFDLSLTGFDEFELGELFAERTQGRTDPDDAPEPPAHPVAEPDDLWVLGRHRLLCGDSTVALSTSSAFSSSAVKVTNSPRAYSYPLTTSRLSISSPVAGSCGRSVTRVAAGLWSPSRLASSTRSRGADGAEPCCPSPRSDRASSATSTGAGCHTRCKRMDFARVVAGDK